MAHLTLERADDWHLEHAEQDIRGWPVRDAAGRTVGTIDKMIVDTDRAIVDTLVLDDGTELAAADITIGDDVVFLGAARTEPLVMPGAEPVVAAAVYDGDGKLVEQDVVFDDGTIATFREHHGATYAATEYADYDPAYRFGYRAACDARYTGRTYADAEPDLRTDYDGQAIAGRSYDDLSDAIRHGFDQFGRSHRHDAPSHTRIMG